MGKNGSNTIDAPAVQPMSEATAARYGKLMVHDGVLARFPFALLAVAAVSEYGTQKHQVPSDDMSYLDVPNAAHGMRNASARHVLKRAIEGEEDPDGNECLHLAEQAWNDLGEIEKMLRDRYDAWRRANPDGLLVDFIDQEIRQPAVKK